MTLRRWQLHDPARLISEVADSFPLVEGSALLALVHRPSTRQKLVGVERLRTPA